MILREKKMKEEIDKMEVKMVMWPKWGGIPMSMECENLCGKFNTKEKKPVRRYYDYQGGKGDYACLCQECFISLCNVETKKKEEF